MAPSTTATTKRAASRARGTAKKAAASARKATTARKSSAARTRGAAKKASSGRRRTPDALDVLVQDHHTVEDLFTRFEKSGSGARKRRQQLVDKIIHELSVHAAIEEEVLYPAARREVPGTNDDVLESLEEHHIVKWTLSELEHLGPDDERFEPKMTVLMESVRHHVEEEEKELFPQLRKALDATRLEELGRALAAAKRSAPTRPHPRSPDTPPGNIVAQAITAPFDAVANVTEATADRVRDFVT